MGLNRYACGLALVALVSAEAPSAHAASRSAQAPAATAADQAQPRFDALTALEREWRVRDWARGLLGVCAAASDDEVGAADRTLLAEWHAALQSAAWPERRAAVLAVARVPPWILLRADNTAPLLAPIANALLDAHPSVVEAALRVGAQHALFDDWIARGHGARLAALAREPFPGVREALATAAGRFPPPVLELAAPHADHAPRMDVFVGGLLDDADEHVRAEALAAFLLAELPASAGAGEPALLARWQQHRVDALRQATQRGALAEAVAYLELLARAGADAGFADAAALDHELPSAWAQLSDSDVAIWEGLLQAVIRLRGGAADPHVLANGFVAWLGARRRIELNLDTWRYIDRLYENAVERPGLDHGIAQMRAIEAHFATLGAYDEWLDAMRNGHSERELVELSQTTPNGFLNVFELFANGLDRGCVWSDIEPLHSWFEADALIDERKYALLSIGSALARGHLDRPDAETEAALLRWIERRDFAFDPADTDGFLPADIERHNAAFRALCLARSVRGGELQPAGWADAERFFGVLSASFHDVWLESKGVRLDLLMRLPRLPELEAFADLLILVGDTGGVKAGYRADCVELLGACRGSARVADALERWFAEEWPAEDVDVLMRTDEFELAGLVRAIGANGAGIGRGRGAAERALELATRAGKDGVARNLARAALEALARYDGGLAAGAQLLLDDWRAGEAGWLDARGDAALRVLEQGAAWRAANTTVVGLARDFMMAEIERLESDQVERFVRELGRGAGADGLDFLEAQLHRRVGQRGGLDGVGPFVDALVARYPAADAERRASIEAGLRYAAQFASLMEWRGLAYMGLSRVVALRLVAGEARGPLDVAGDLSLAVLCAAAFENGAASWAALSRDERDFLRDQALFAIARVVGGLAGAGSSGLVRQGTEPDSAAAEAHLLSGAVSLDALLDALSRRTLPPVLEVSAEDQRERWAGESPRGGDFVTQTAEQVFGALGSTAARRRFLSADPGWLHTDPLFLRRLAELAGGADDAGAAALERELLDLAWIARGPESAVEAEVAVDLVARRLLDARKAGDWLTVGIAADELAARWRRTGIWERSANEAFWVGGLLGSYLPKEGREPQARVEAWRYQAAAHRALATGADPTPWLARAREAIGASSRAAADQAELSSAQSPKLPK